MGEINEQIKTLQAKVKELEASIAPTPYPDAAAAARWKDEMHQASEARASRFNPFTREQLAEMERAAPTATVRDIAMRDARAPTGPSSQGIIPSSQTVSNVRGAGGGTGWAYQAPLRPQPGINYVDQQLDAQDRKDKAERIVQEARMEAIKPK